MPRGENHLGCDFTAGDSSNRTKRSKPLLATPGIREREFHPARIGIVITDWRGEIVKQFRKPTDMVWMGMRKPILANFQLVSLEESRYLLRFPAWINNYSETTTPNDDAIGHFRQRRKRNRKRQHRGFNRNTLNLNFTRFHTTPFPQQRFRFAMAKRCRMGRLCRLFTFYHTRIDNK